MSLYHIVAVAKNHVIGKDNKLPWHFSADLKHFKQRTSGSTVIMGRKTYDSIGKPLPNRENFVLSRTPEIVTPPAGDRSGRSNLRFFCSVDEALAAVKTPDAYIIGGSEIFKQTLNKVDGIYLTRIDAEYEGDTFYPEIIDDFEEVEIKELQENPRIEVVFYQKKQKPTQEGSAG